MFDFERLFTAYLSCRKRKRNTRNAQRYEVDLLDRLMTTEQQLLEQSWKPGRSVFFIALQPKAREIHAADFADRVVHHLLVPQLEALYEPIFIHDVYSNWQGKGTHRAVKRLQHFMRGARNDGGRACYLQMDVRNFFNSIDRPLLFRLINHRLKKSVDKKLITDLQAWQLSGLVHALLRTHPAENTVRRGPDWTFERVPEYKRLSEVGEHKGLPIGNLTSQFFANVYLNELDQFIKHELKCKYYLRYVDDWVIVHHDAEQLRVWRKRIEESLWQRLMLEVKPDPGPRDLRSGADFLGYIVRPDYLLARRRVVHALRLKLRQFEVSWVEHREVRGLSDDSSLVTPRAAQLIHLERDSRDALRAVLASYLGHLRHAACWGLVHRLWADFPWLKILFELDWQSAVPSLTPRWEPLKPRSLREQWGWFKRLDTSVVVLMQVGTRHEAWQDDAVLLSRLSGRPLISPDPQYRPAIRRLLPMPSGSLPLLRKRLRQQGIPYLQVQEEGYLKGGLKRRVMRQHYSLTPVTSLSGGVKP